MWLYLEVLLQSTHTCQSASYKLLLTVSSAQTRDQRSALAGHVARALAVFCVDEVVVFDDGNAKGVKKQKTTSNGSNSRNDTSQDDPDHFLVHLLSYLETPPHLRKLLFPIHPNLEAAGKLPSLDLPHHLKSDEWCPYREGVTLPGADEHGTFVEAGLRIPVTVKDQIPENTRVTVKFAEDAESAQKDSSAPIIAAEPVNPDEPREEAGYYWGFKVRRAESLSSVFTECEYDEGYDISIGTSERGISSEQLYSGSEEEKVGNFKHMLVVFGGVAGLEVALKNDAELQKLRVTDAKDAFDRWVNVCPGQGSRTIRTEEAIWIGLMGLRKLVTSNA